MLEHRYIAGLREERYRYDRGRGEIVSTFSMVILHLSVLYKTPRYFVSCRSLNWHIAPTVLVSSRCCAHTSGQSRKRGKAEHIDRFSIRANSMTLQSFFAITSFIIILLSLSLLCFFLGRQSFNAKVDVWCFHAYCHWCVYLLHFGGLPQNT